MIKSFRNIQQLPYGDTSFTGVADEVSLGVKAIDLAGNEYLLLRGISGIQSGDVVLYDRNFNVVRSVEGAQTGTNYQGVAVYAGEDDSPADSNDKCGYFGVKGTFATRVAGTVVANGTLFLSATAGQLSNAGTTQIPNAIASSAPVAGVANVTLFAITSLVTGAASSSGPVTATTITSTGQADIASDDNLNNFFGNGDNSTNTIGSGNGAVNNIGNAAGASTNNLYGTNNIDKLNLTPYNSPDLPAGGSIGSAATTVDARSLFTINQTTAGQTLSVPNPTDPSKTAPYFFTNSGTQSFTIFGIPLAPGESIFALWDGDSYNAQKVGGAAVVANAIFDGGTSTGAGTNTYAITAPNKTGALIAGDMFSFATDAVGIAGAATLNVNGLGATQILLPTTSAPDMTQLPSGYQTLAYFNGTDFFIMNFPTTSSSSLVFPFFIS